MNVLRNTPILRRKMIKQMSTLTPVASQKGSPVALAFERTSSLRGSLRNANSINSKEIKENGVLEREQLISDVIS